MAYSSIIFICSHCGEKFGMPAKFCKLCRTAEQRKEVARQNEEIFGKTFIPASEYYKNIFIEA